MPEPLLELDETVPIELPNGWSDSVQRAALHVMSLAGYAFARGTGLVMRYGSPSARQKARDDQYEREIAHLREEIRIKDARMASMAPAKRPYYGPCERLAILELRAARNWSLAQTARVFLVADKTVASWTQRLDESGPNALLQTREPVNKFPDFVRHNVQRLTTLCPTLGKVKIAQTLAMAGLHLAVSTVGRMRREPPVAAPQSPTASEAETAEPARPAPTPAPVPKPAAKRITARYPNHLWHVDLTMMSIFGGAWTTWLPFALPACFPFCWWLCVVLDHYSRRVMGVTVFFKQPTAAQVKQFMGQVIAKAGQVPKYLVSDQGAQFVSAAFQSWWTRRGIHQRFGAIGQHGSIAVIERSIRTLKELLRGWPVVSLIRRTFLHDVHSAADWYNQHRAHTTLKGATPDEIYFHKRPANRQPRFEPRPNWPRGSPCAAPQVLVKGQPGVRLELSVDFHAGQRHLPIVRLSRVA